MLSWNKKIVLLLDFIDVTTFNLNKIIQFTGMDYVKNVFNDILQVIDRVNSYSNIKGDKFDILSKYINSLIYRFWWT